MSAQKFLEICESVLTRTERGGFLVGDMVEITDFNKIDSDNIRDGLKELVDQGVNIKVVDIVNKYPSDKPGSQLNNSGDVVLVVSGDYGGGRYVGKFIIPTTCCTVIHTYPNLHPIPDALKRDNMVTIKPEPVPSFDDLEFAKQSNHADNGKGKLERVAGKLGTKNQKQPGPKPPKYAPDF
jgi:hypothetical protein